MDQDDMNELLGVEETTAAERVDEHEPSVIELMNGPPRPSERSKQTVLWLCFAFVCALIALTFMVMTFYGVTPLSIISLVILGFLAAAMIGALRYKGEDPMAQFDPPRQPKSKLFWRREIDSDSDR
ncbi:MAG: hypothetical protein ACPGWS_04455 [Solirubrobacterales bacterium]